MLLMLSVVLLLLLSLATCIIAQSCTPQQLYNPGGNVSAMHVGGYAYRLSDLSSQTITVATPSIVTALNVYPFASFNGTFSVSAGLFTPIELVTNAHNSTVYVTAQLLAQSAVNVTVNASYPSYLYTGQPISPTPLILTLPAPLFLAPGNYSLVWWYSFINFTPRPGNYDFFYFVTYDACSKHLGLVTEGSNFNFTEQKGVFPDSFNHTQFTGRYYGSPGILVSLTADTCAVESSSSSSSSGGSSNGSSTSSGMDSSSSGGGSTSGESGIIITSSLSSSTEGTSGGVGGSSISSSSSSGGELSSSGSEAPHESSSSNTMAIAIAVVAVLAVIAIVVALCVMYRRRKAAAATTANGLSADRRSRLLADEEERASSDRYGEYRY